MAWYWAAAVVQMFVSSVVCTQLRWSPWADLNLNMAWPNIYITSASTETTIYSECKYLLTRVRSELWSNYRVSVSNHNNYGIIWNVISKYAYSISFWILHSVEFWFRYVCVCVCVCSDGTNRTEFLVRFSLLLLLVAGSEVNSLIQLYRVHKGSQQNNIVPTFGLSYRKWWVNMNTQPPQNTLSVWLPTKSRPSTVSHFMGSFRTFVDCPAPTP